MKFDVLNRWTRAVQFSAEISCDECAMPWVKVGLAVRWARLRGAVLTGAVLTGADLTGAVLRGADLTGADLTGAVLTGADLTGAVLTGADLTGAVLTGADLTGAVLTGAVLTGAVGSPVKIDRLLASVNRLDGYTFYLWLLDGGAHLIKAGCQTNTIAGYRDHIAAAYPSRHNAAALTRETLAILDYFERRLTDETLTLKETPNDQ